MCLRSAALLWGLVVRSFCVRSARVTKVDYAFNASNGGQDSMCCCKKGACSEDGRRGTGMVELNAEVVYCCKPQPSCSQWYGWTINAETKHFPDRVLAGTPGQKLDSQCKQDCSYLQCNKKHGRAVNKLVMDSFLSYCDCQCDPGWDPANLCDTRLYSSTVSGSSLSPLGDYVPEVSWPLDTLKYTAKDLIEGPYALCVITQVELVNKPVEPNPLLPKKVIVEVQDILRPIGHLQPLNALAHCGLKLTLGGSFCPCNGESILLEHQQEINAIEWSQNLADAFLPVGQWNVVDRTGIRCDSQVETNSLYSDPRGPTIFELLYALFNRDPRVQEYSVSKKNCCHFARAVAAVLLPPEELAAFDGLLQNPVEIDKASKQVMGKYSAKQRKWLVKMVGKATGKIPEFEAIDPAAAKCSRKKWPRTGSSILALAKTLVVGSLARELGLSARRPVNATRSTETSPGMWSEYRSHLNE